MSRGSLLLGSPLQFCITAIKSFQLPQNVFLKKGDEPADKFQEDILRRYLSVLIYKITI